MSARTGFVRLESAPARPPPMVARGATAWVRARLFSNWLSGLLTVGSALFLAWLLPDLIRFFFIDAVWSAPDGALCRAPGAGACWAFVAHKVDYFRYGSYPLDERWRIDATLMFGAVLVARLLWRSDRRTRLQAMLFVLAVPLAAAVLTPGPLALLARPWPEAALLLAAISFAGALWTSRLALHATTLLFFIVYPVIGFFLLRGSPLFGLAVVDTSLWGGVFVSLLVAIVGIVFSLPAGVLLALGRRSRLPAVRFCTSAFIEFVRGVPLITVLFMANTMLPLFVPQELTPDRLLRPLIGVAVFAAAYMAEVVRAGLQAMPRGQYEGAMSLGLGYWRMMRLVILPQALVVVIPGIVNSFISLFKDTTLVAVVGIFDFLRTVDTARLDPAWAGPTITTTGYAFAALFYWIFCFGMSRYSLMMERKLNAGRRQ